MTECRDITQGTIMAFDKDEAVYNRYVFGYETLEISAFKYLGYSFTND